MRRLFFVLFLTGCGFLSKSAPPKLYSLDRVAGATVAAAGLPIGIDNVELPPGVDRRELVVRQSDNRLEVRANEQWSAPFRDLVLHTLAFDLASRLPVGMVIVPGEPRPAAARAVSVSFEELAAHADRTVVLDARWIVQNVAHHDRIVVNVPSLDAAAIAAGVSQALGGLADRMAAP
jgi:uncharacterized lipoprotein YmbA